MVGWSHGLGWNLPIPMGKTSCGIPASLVTLKSRRGLVSSIVVLWSLTKSWRCGSGQKKRPGHFFWKSNSRWWQLKNCIFSTGNDPFWRIFFKWVGEKTPTRIADSPKKSPLLENPEKVILNWNVYLQSLKRLAKKCDRNFSVYQILGFNKKKSGSETKILAVSPWNETRPRPLFWGFASQHDQPCNCNSGEPKVSPWGSEGYGSPWDDGWIVFSVLLKWEAFKRNPWKGSAKKTG